MVCPIYTPWEAPQLQNSFDILVTVIVGLPWGVMEHLIFNSVVGTVHTIHTHAGLHMAGILIVLHNVMHSHAWHGCRSVVCLHVWLLLLHFLVQYSL